MHNAFPNNLVSEFPAFGPKTLSKVVRGDVEKGFEDADCISEGTFGYENIANPLPIEPPGVIAQWEDDHRLTVWSGTQSASWHRWIMQSKMGFPDIRAITTQCGGSFGSKNYAPQCLFYAAALARATGPTREMASKTGSLNIRVSSSAISSRSRLPTRNSL